VQRALERSDAVEVLSAARFAHVAVSSTSGPHVTLAAYVVSSGQLWFAASRNTVKVRSIRRSPTVSVLVCSADRSLLLTGRAQVMSGWGVEDIAHLLGNAVDAGVAAAAFALRHGDMLARSTRDFVGDRNLPLDRVLVGLNPTRGMIIDGDLVTRRWGRWHSSSRPPRSRKASASALVLDGVPRRAARPLIDHRACAVGWECPWGPLVMPGRARGGGSEVEVPAEVMLTAGPGGRCNMCVTLDRGSNRAGNFSGIIVRGEGTVTKRIGSNLRIALASDRVNWWSGFKTGTVHRK
jgi:hypothetical protein